MRIEALGRFDDTLVIYITGDNGASAEGTVHGAWSAPSFQNGVHEDPEWLLEHIDDFGTARCENHYNVGLGLGPRRAVPVDEAGRFALRWDAQCNGDVVAASASPMPAGCARQFHHVVDIAATIYEAVGIDGAGARERY